MSENSQPQTNKDATPGNYKLFIGGLNWETDEKSFKTFFEKFGTVTEVKIPVNLETNQRRGFGFVSFLDKKTYEEVLKSSKERSLILDKKYVEAKPVLHKSQLPPKPYSNFGRNAFNPSPMYASSRGYNYHPMDPYSNGYARFGYNPSGNMYGQNAQSGYYSGQSYSGGYTPNNSVPDYDYNPQIQSSYEQNSSSQSASGQPQTYNSAYPSQSNPKDGVSGSNASNMYRQRLNNASNAGQYYPQTQQTNPGRGFDGQTPSNTGQTPNLNASYPGNYPQTNTSYNAADANGYGPTGKAHSSASYNPY